MITGIKYTRPDGVTVEERMRRDGTMTTKMRAPRGKFLDLRSVFGIERTPSLPAKPLWIPPSATRDGFRQALERCKAERENMDSLRST